MSVSMLEMPRLGETMDEGRIVRWLKAPGDSFARGEALLEIETDKTVAEVPALSAGRLLEILEPDDSMVEVGQPIARVEAEGMAKTDPAPEPVPEAPSAAEMAPMAPAVRPEQPAAPASERVRATPLARRIARDAGIAIATLTGTGVRGRIEANDVRTAMGAAPQTVPQPARGHVDVFEVDGGRLAFVDAGPQDGPPYVLLHGFGADHTTFSVLMSALARGGHRVVVPDLPGHGLTSLAANSGTDLGAGLAEMLSARAFRGPVHLVAHSLGSAPALALAQSGQIAIETLTLIAPAGMTHQIDVAFITGLAQARSAGEVSHLLRRLSLRDPGLSPAALAAIAEEMGRGRLLALADDIAGPNGQRLDLLPALRAVANRLPVRIVQGLQDQIVPWQQVTGLPPQVAIHLFAGSGHVPHWDQAEEVLKIISH